MHRCHFISNTVDWSPCTHHPLIYSLTKTHSGNSPSAVKHPLVTLLCQPKEPKIAINHSPGREGTVYFTDFTSHRKWSLSFKFVTATDICCINWCYIFSKEFLMEGIGKTDAFVDMQILFSLCLVLLAVYIVFPIGIELTGDIIVCKVLSALLQYLLLAAFGWMLVEGVRQFLRYYIRSHCLPERFYLTGFLFSFGRFCFVWLNS